MFQVIYISAAVEPMRPAALERLLATCRANNERFGLTGLLVYKDDRFMEALEGPKENVKRMYASIREDERHEGLIQMVGWPVGERDFPGRPMAFRADGASEIVDAGRETLLAASSFSEASPSADLSFRATCFGTSSKPPPASGGPERPACSPSAQPAPRSSSSGHAPDAPSQ